MNIAFVDHRDSFSYNVVHALGVAAGRAPVVVDFESARDLVPRAERLQMLVLGPGPGHVERRADRGSVDELLGAIPPDLHVFGVCFGMQAIVHHLGGRVRRARRVVHGKGSRIRHDGEGLFRGLADGVVMMRYHSWAVDEAALPKNVSVRARAADGEVMALECADRPWAGVQFHPESVGSEDGARLFENLVARVREGVRAPRRSPEWLVRCSRSRGNENADGSRREATE